MLRLYVLLTVIGFCVWGCSDNSRPTTVQTASAVDFDKVFANAYEEYLEYVLPNSMARPPGFDMNRHLTQVYADFQRLSGPLGTEAGVRYLDNLTKTEKDETKVCCAIKILAETSRSDAQPILERLRNDPRAVVAQNAEGGIEQRQHPSTASGSQH